MSLTPLDFTRLMVGFLSMMPMPLPIFLASSMTVISRPSLMASATSRPAKPPPTTTTRLPTIAVGPLAMLRPMRMKPTVPPCALMAATAAFQMRPLPSGTMPATMSLMSCELTTFLPSMPGTSTPMTSPPGATTTSSGLSALTVSASTFVFSLTSMLGCSFISSFQYDTRGSIFSLSTCAMLSSPPTRSDLSSTVTLCPRTAATRAASSPPGPAPTTTTCFFSSAGLSSGCPSAMLSILPLTEHQTGWPRNVWSRQRLHTMQGRTCSG